MAISGTSSTTFGRSKRRSSRTNVEADHKVRPYDRNPPCDFPALLRRRVGPHLELHQLARVPLAAFGVERSARRVGREDRLALPAAVRVVDAAVHALRE